MTDIRFESGFNEADRVAIVSLLRAYEANITTSLQFQDFETELADLPGAYAPPRGQLILARRAADGALIGCVALRPVPDDPAACEMKRLFVLPQARAGGLGRRLALAAISEARRMGYTRICLDTLPEMVAAQTLYRDLGFRHSGVAGTEPRVLLFERELGEGA